MPVYDFASAEDRARFLLSLPRDRLDERRTWLEIWEKRYGDMEETKRLVREQWQGNGKGECHGRSL